MTKAFAAATCLGLLTISSAMADQWNKKTHLTVNEPVSVPGKVLQPGRYVMRLLDSPSNRHIVQIYNDREDQLQTTVLAIPNYRMQPTGKTEFQWWETPAGQPKAMRAWFYPGDNFGQEFAYPKTQAVSIAAANNASVPTTYAQTETELTTARVGTVDKAGTEQELDRQTYNAPQQTQQMAQATPQATQRTEIAQATPQATPQDTMPARTLPRTGSEMPLFGLAGFLALGAGAAVRALGSRR
jgi:LPXTG-motif cell wall-anchored protein